MLERLNYPVGRLRHRIEPETLGATGTLFLLQPEVGLDRDEVAACCWHGSKRGMRWW